jgi:hypothetical protein
MDGKPLYVLIHSPLVGPSTWQPVRRELERRGMDAITPALTDQPESRAPFWEQHARSIAQTLKDIPDEQPLVLVAHSGAGPILPALRHGLAQAAAAYIFVDAGLPRNGLSRLDLMRLQDAHWTDDFQRALLDEVPFPAWSDAELKGVIPDDLLRQGMLAELQPRGLSFFTEPLPVFSAWPDAPCAYIHFSVPYNWDFEQARASAWPVRSFEAGHFHMLVDPPAVADALMDITRELIH